MRTCMERGARARLVAIVWCCEIAEVGGALGSVIRESERTSSGAAAHGRTAGIVTIRPRYVARGRPIQVPWHGHYYYYSMCLLTE